MSLIDCTQKFEYKFNKQINNRNYMQKLYMSINITCG